MTLACKTAIVKRDVAHLIFPDNVQTLPAKDTRASGPAGRITDSTIAPDEQSIDEALSLISQSRRPIVIAGYGARESMDTVIELADRLNSPILTTFKAKGQIPDDHPLAAGVLGRSGTMVASWFMNECDLILVFGASFSNHTGITQKRPVIQVDFDRMQLGKFHPVTLPVWGEIGVTARMMAARLTGAGHTVDQRPELEKRWAIWRKEKESRTRRRSPSTWATTPTHLGVISSAKASAS
jgi:thiamine pyrophosphate-dependent acetolactate synthase large subunit-like protein